MLLLLTKPKHVAPPLRWGCRASSWSSQRPRRHLIFEGRTTNDGSSDALASSPFCFETGYSIFAKRPSRPFPPPFLSTPSTSFSDPLTTHKSVRDRRPSVGDQLIRGITNGDDAVIIGGQNFLGVNDGVGAWAQKERGHAALWSRLIAHYWAVEVQKAFEQHPDINVDQINMAQYLQSAFDQTKAATTNENEIMGTTTASAVLLHHTSDGQAVVLATTLGDCAIFVIRPPAEEVLYKSTEQWHWFDCPRQLGTNSPDTPEAIAVTDVINIREGDVVLVMSDGVTDNLWENEICDKVSKCMKSWQDGEDIATDGVVYVARELMNAAREIAQDPNAESPYMERALDEGIAAEGGKLDDISVLVGVCRKRK